MVARVSAPTQYPASSAMQALRPQQTAMSMPATTSRVSTLTQRPLRITSSAAARPAATSTSEVATSCHGLRCRILTSVYPRMLSRQGGASGLSIASGPLGYNLDELQLLV